MFKFFASATVCLSVLSASQALAVCGMGPGSQSQQEIVAIATNASVMEKISYGEIESIGKDTEGSGWYYVVSNACSTKVKPVWVSYGFPRRCVISTVEVGATQCWSVALPE